MRFAFAMQPIMTTPELFAYRDDQTELLGEVYRPRLANGKAVLVVHEADGIGGNVRRHCRLLTDLGYVAFAADMHGAGHLLEPKEIALALTRFREDPDYTRKRVGSGLKALGDLTGLGVSRMAAIGYCFGGMAVLELARSGAPLAAVASFHGLLTTAIPAVRGSVRARVLACTGARDPLVPFEDITTFQEEMSRAEADWQLAIFGRALHSFTNREVDRLGDERMGFDPEAEIASWTLLRLFLERSFAICADPDEVE